MNEASERLAEAFDLYTTEFEQWIDRRFAARRELVVANDEGKFWTAAIGDNVLYRSPDGRSVLRFARTFAERTPGVSVELAEVTEHDGYSVRVDNVVPLKAGA
jgi:hypothetical protein